MKSHNPLGEANELLPPDFEQRMKAADLWLPPAEMPNPYATPILDDLFLDESEMVLSLGETTSEVTTDFGIEASALEIDKINDEAPLLEFAAEVKKIEDARIAAGRAALFKEEEKSTKPLKRSRSSTSIILNKTLAENKTAEQIRNDASAAFIACIIRQKSEVYYNKNKEKLDRIAKHKGRIALIKNSFYKAKKVVKPSNSRTIFANTRLRKQGRFVTKEEEAQMRRENKSLLRSKKK